MVGSVGGRAKPFIEAAENIKVGVRMSRQKGRRAARGGAQKLVG